MVVIFQRASGIPVIKGAPTQLLGSLPPQDGGNDFLRADHDSEIIGIGLSVFPPQPFLSASGLGLGMLIRTERGVGSL